MTHTLDGGLAQCTYEADASLLARTGDGRVVHIDTQGGHRAPGAAARGAARGLA